MGHSSKIPRPCPKRFRPGGRRRCSKTTAFWWPAGQFWRATTGWRYSNPPPKRSRSEEHTSELQSRGDITYAGFCLKKETGRWDGVVLAERFVRERRGVHAARP